MERYNALTIQLEEWMLNPSFMQYVDILQIEATEEAGLRGEIPRIWVGNYDESIFSIAEGEMNILKNLLLWYDDGEKEVRINEHNYRNYPSSGFYKTRKGTYDTNIEAIL